MTSSILASAQAVTKLSGRSWPAGRKLSAFPYKKNHRIGIKTQKYLSFSFTSNAHIVLFQHHPIPDQPKSSMVDRYISSPDNRHHIPFNCKKTKKYYICLKFIFNSTKMVTTLNILCFGFDVIPSNPLGCLLGNQRRPSFPRDSWPDYKWVQMHSHSSISQGSSVHRWGHHVHPCYNLIKSWNSKITT